MGTINRRQFMARTGAATAACVWGARG
ncbi:MAG: twin-arginine translocation signal domain-containing protein, partial [Candidatus Hydrogenedentes bacterium]|nr:twin-arginine translocation signal domain-containing protein [Candidatus Hydrogenedentota bacterium]MCC6698730.1 twin-arginine translocation signal domain-containing protein [Candidatus Hydrogenedentota bacterium]